MKKSRLRILALITSLLSLPAAAAPDLSLATLSGVVEHLLSLSPVEVAAAERGNGPGRPLVYAMAAAQRFSDSDGNWVSLADDYVQWRLLARGLNATSMAFRLQQAALPPGAELWISSVDGGHRHGPYTADDLKAGVLRTPAIPVDAALLIVEMPASERAGFHLGEIRTLIGFLNVWKADDVRFKEGGCYLDIACAQPSFQTLARSVARIEIGQTPITVALCSGTLLNNTANNQKPLFLTANHCISTNTQAADTNFYWNYQSSKCGSATLNSAQTSVGATLRATNEATDFTLIEANSRPNDNFRVLYAGWDRGELPPSSSFTIHHPDGTHKRISFDNDPPVITFLPAIAQDVTAGPPGSAFEILDWDVGSTEGGSSGGPLFNPAGQVIGQLSRGSSACGGTDPGSSDGQDYFGRLALSWDNGTSASSRLKDWLDPVGGNAMSTNSLDPFAGMPTGGTNGGSGGASGGTGGTAGGTATGGQAGGGGQGGSQNGTGSTQLNSDQSDSGGGCTVSNHRKPDPTLLFLLSLALGGCYLNRRRAAAR